MGPRRSRVLPGTTHRASPNLICRTADRCRQPRRSWPPWAAARGRDRQRGDLVNCRSLVADRLHVAVPAPDDFDGGARAVRSAVLLHAAPHLRRPRPRRCGGAAVWWRRARTRPRARANRSSRPRHQARRGPLRQIVGLRQRRMIRRRRPRHPRSARDGPGRRRPPPGARWCARCRRAGATSDG